MLLPRYPTSLLFQITLVSLGLVLSLPTPTQAQTSTAFDLSVSPPVTYLVLEPGQTASYPLVIAHEGTISLTITPKVRSFRADERGMGIQLEEEVVFPYLDPAQPNPFAEPFVLQPGEKKTFSVPILVPTDSSTNEAHLTLLFEGSAVTPPVLGLSQADLTGAVGTNLILMVKTSEADQAQLLIKKYQGPHLIDSFSPITFQLLAKNIGPIAGIATGSASITTGSNKELANFVFFPDSVLADSSRHLRTLPADQTLADETLEPTFTFSYKSPFLLGIYKVQVVLASSTQTSPSVGNFQVIALPFSLFFLIAIGAFLYIGYKVFSTKLALAKRLRTY